MDRPRPTRAELEASRGSTIPDVLRPGLRVVFCGINPSLYSAAIGHHFGRPGNRFWPALHRGGFTDRLYSPFEDADLLALGLGLTNIVPQATARADELTEEVLEAGGRAMVRKLRRFRPAWLAILGVTAYRTAFRRPRAIIGVQEEIIGATRLWVLPNPSGLNAHHSLADLGTLFAALRIALN